MGTSEIGEGNAEFEYVSGQYRVSFPSLLAAFEKESAACCEELSGRELDIRYGPGELECYDFFPTQGPAKGVMVFFHAGYWQSRDKCTFRFIAKAFAEHGVHVALVNYPLCPSVNIAEIIESAERAIYKIRDYRVDGKAVTAPMLLVGHSAGAQIALELAMKIGGSCSDLLQQIAGIVGISGVYDLVPLVQTTLNRNLHLDTAMAHRLSPAHKTVYLGIPAVFMVGKAETPAFLRQNRQMGARWRDAGNPCEQMESEADDHFSVLRTLADPHGRVFLACQRLFAAWHA